MTERYTTFENFESATLSQALAAEARSTRDVAHGVGATFTLGEGKAELEVYPATGVARVTTQNARVELFRVPGATTDDEAGRVVFQHGDEDNRRRLLVRADGIVSFYPLLRATGGARKGEAPDGPLIGPQAPQTTSEDATAGSTTDSAAPPESQDRPVMTLTGRLGRDPWFNRAGEELRAGFPLAVNHDEGATWHTVVARGEVADQIDEGKRRGYIRKGREVTVTGAHAEQTDKGKARFEATIVTKPQSSQRRRPR